MKLLYSLAAILAAAPLWAGVRIKVDDTNYTSKETTHQEILLDGDRLRVNDSGRNNSVLFLTDGGRSRMVMLDSSKNEYREIDQQTMAQISQQLQGALGALQSQLQNLPPEQRARIEQMMRGRGLPGQATAAPRSRTVYTATGSGSVAGFSCRKYDGVEGGEKVAEVCAAKASDLHLSAADLQAYDKMREFASGLTAAFTNLPNVRVPDITEQGFEGFPIERTSFSGGKAVSKGELKSIEHATFSDADFSLGSAKKVDAIPPGLGRK